MTFLKLTKTKILFLAIFAIIASFAIAQNAHATDGLIGDVADFSASSNWNFWIVRHPNSNSGRGQTFKTAPGTETISSVGLKVCRTNDFSKPKKMTLCSSLQNGWFGGCSDPLATKEFSAEELNNLIPQDPNCYSSNEGGDMDGEYYKWTVFSFDEPVVVQENTSYTFVINSGDNNDNEGGNVLASMYNNCTWLGSSANYLDGQTYYFRGANRFADSEGELCDMFFKVFSANPIIVPFEITSHQTDSPAIEEEWMTVDGTCPINGEDRIGFTNDCLGFESIDYNVSCIDNQFSGEFYKSSASDKLIARDIDSVSGDCVDYDDLMDAVTLSGLEIIEGYPDDWYFDFDYYQDYDIKIKSPIYDNTLSLPIGSTETDFTFAFIFPDEEVLSDLNFNIQQYDENGTLTNASYHNTNLSDITNVYNHTVTLTVPGESVHYVVQLTSLGEMKRQFPIAIFVSDLDLIINPDDGGYLFPRLVEELKKKILFNYYFAFHDGFYTMFSTEASDVADDALDITFKSVSGNGEYDLDVMIFSASDPRVKSLTNGLRPYITAILWLGFAVYVIFRITHLFSDNE
jgi:hypothetical protein